MTRRAMALGAALALAAPALAAQAGYQPAPENLAARQWFQDAKFGMFIHWGVYSVLGAGEWVMNNRGLTVEEYEKLPAFFNPVRYDPAQWVALAKAAGMKYITITTKHHDGFAMWHSKNAEWNVVDRTPYGKDVIGMLAEECRKQGIKLFFYHSQLDWHNPDYYPRGFTGKTAGRPDSGSWSRYLDYLDGQLTELLTGYGPVGGIWFDGMWDKPDADWRLDRTYALIHRLQPAALIGSNHHRAPFPGEDFQMFEKDLPGKHTTGFNQDQTVSQLPLETAETMNDSWGFNIGDDHYKSVPDLIRYLVRAAGNNANFLLNVGPEPDGTIQPEFASRLREIGAWLSANGTAIYATRGGPIAPGPWGVSTQRHDTVFVHVLDWDTPLLALAPLSGRIRSAALLRDGSRVAFRQTPEGIVLTLPRRPADLLDEIVILAR
ncbi:MAG TPA: alpha-L-fucosidase [Gemmatimonadales bacterium]|nr:alpha-L-fucosidase [Gemmatimonadales bacterium]